MKVSLLEIYIQYLNEIYSSTEMKCTQSMCGYIDKLLNSARKYDYEVCIYKEYRRKARS